jgi:hypothetical protein
MTESIRINIDRILRALADTLLTIKLMPVFYNNYDNSEKSIERLRLTNRHNGSEHWTTGAHVWHWVKLLIAKALSPNRDIYRGMI